MDLNRRFFRLAFLNILANLTVPLTGLVDTAMLGHLPDIRFLAGVALASVLFDFIYWGFGFLRMGTTGMTAQAFGRCDTREVFLVLYRSLALATAAAASVLVLLVPLRELGFAALGGEAAVEAAGRAYYDARIWGAPATLANFVLVGWFLGREQSRHVLVMTIVANVANVAFNYLFIIRLGLAAFGAGLATMVSQYLMLAVGVAIFLAQPGSIPLRRAEIVDPGELGRLLRLNRDILVRTFLLVSAFALFTNFSSLLGVGVLAANAILLRLFYVASYAIDGAAFAAESLAGIFRGQRDLRALDRLVRLGLISGLGFALLFLAGLLPDPGRLIGLLTVHRDAIETSARYAPWLVPVVLFGSTAFMYDGMFLGLTEGRALRNAMAASMLGVFLPLALWSVARGDNHLLWLAMAAFMVARTVTLAWSLARLRRGFIAEWA